MSEVKKTKIQIVDTSDHTDDDIVEHLIVKKGVPIGDEGEVTIVEEYVETKRYNRQKYINSFRDEVGIVNLLKKVNAGLLNPGVLAANFDMEGKKVIDISQVPTDVGDAVAMVDQAHILFASLPAELKAGMDFNTFCKTFDQAKYNAYVESLKKKKEEVNNE